MRTKCGERPRTRFVRHALAIAVALAVASGLATAGTGIAADADEVLREMSNYVGSLPAFSVDADVTVEYIDLDGQKLQLCSSGSILLARPGNYYAKRRGPSGSFEVYADGKTATLSNRERGVYFKVPVPGTIDGVISTLRNETGLEMSGADLLYADSYAGLLTDVRTGTYEGIGYINGVECHHLAFRAAKVDWQIWVQTGDQPLPMKYLITTKWMTGAPEYVVTFDNWNVRPEVPAGRFVFTPASGATRLETLQFNEMGEVELGGGKP